MATSGAATRLVLATALIGTFSVPVVAEVPPYDLEAAREWTSKGARLMDSGQVTEAITAFKDAAKAAPERAEIYFNLALAHGQLDDCSGFNAYAELVFKIQQAGGAGANLSDGELDDLRRATSVCKGVVPAATILHGVLQVELGDQVELQINGEAAKASAGAWVLPADTEYKISATKKGCQWSESGIRVKPESPTVLAVRWSCSSPIGPLLTAGAGLGLAGLAFYFDQQAGTYLDRRFPAGPEYDLNRERIDYNKTAATVTASAAVGLLAAGAWWWWSSFGSPHPVQTHSP